MKAEAIAKAKREATYARSTVPASASASVVTTTVPAKTEVAAKSVKTLYACNGIDDKISGVSIAWRYFYYAWYSMQLKGSNPAEGKFPIGVSFTMYPSFTSGGYMTKCGYWKKESGVRQFSFTAIGQDHFSKYPCENKSLLSAWVDTIKSGKVHVDCKANTEHGNISMIATDVTA